MGRWDGRSTPRGCGRLGPPLSSRCTSSSFHSHQRGLLCRFLGARLNTALELKLTTVYRHFQPRSTSSLTLGCLLPATCRAELLQVRQEGGPSALFSSSRLFSASLSLIRATKAFELVWRPSSETSSEARGHSRAPQPVPSVLLTPQGGSWPDAREQHCSAAACSSATRGDTGPRESRECETSWIAGCTTDCRTLHLHPYGERSSLHSSLFLAKQRQTSCG